MRKKDIEHEKIKVSVRKIQDLRKRVYDCLRPFVGSTLCGPVFDRATYALSFCVPKSCISITCSQDMLLKFTRQPITAKDVRTIAARVAGNFEHVMSGTPMYDNDWRSRSGWGLVQIFGIEKAIRTFKDGGTQSGAWLDLEVHSGPASGYKLKKFWSSDMFNFAKYRMGFSYPTSNPTSRAICGYPFLDESYVFGLYFLGYFDHMELKGDKPEYTKFLCTDYLVDLNRKLLRKRLRSLYTKEDFKCPMSVAVSTPCHKCPSGVDVCEAAVRRKSYISGDCKSCGQLSWIDPDKSASCINCSSSLSLHVITGPKE